MNRRRPEFLIVDDEEIMRRFLVRELESRGFHSETASNAVEALEKIQNQKFALIVSDLRMPGGNGSMILEAGFAIANFPPIIFMSSCLDSHAETLLARGALAVIEKPTRIKELADQILRYFFPKNSQAHYFHV